MKLTILGNRVLVVPVKEEKVVSGIIISQKNDSEVKRGIVASLGSIDDNEINIGDTVLYKKFLGTPVEYENCEYVMLRYEEILAVIKECKTK